MIQMLQKNENSRGHPCPVVAPQPCGSSQISEAPQEPQITIGEGVFILRTQSLLVRVLIAAAILGELVLPEVGVVLVELGALLTVGLLVGLPFFFFWACSRRAPGPSGSSLLDVAVRVSVGDGGSQACSPPQGASWQEERCRGASEKRCG